MVLNLLLFPYGHVAFPILVYDDPFLFIWMLALGFNLVLLWLTVSMIWGGRSLFSRYAPRPRRSCLFTSRARNRHKSYHYYGNDVRFWFPDPITVAMPYGKTPFGRHRYSNPVRHRQFGIYKRLRRRYSLIPSPRFRPNTTSRSNVEPQNGSPPAAPLDPKRKRQQEMLAEILSDFMKRNPKVADLVQSDDSESSAALNDEISPLLIRCPAEAEAQDDYVEKLCKLLSENGLEEATWEFHVAP